MSVLLIVERRIFDLNNDANCLGTNCIAMNRDNTLLWIAVGWAALCCAVAIWMVVLILRG
jgi:hypothetical protein